VGGEKLSVLCCQPRGLIQLFGRQGSVVVIAALKIHSVREEILTVAIARHRHEQSGIKEMIND
jgi:hypothetical protein